MKGLQQPYSPVARGWPKVRARGAAQGAGSARSRTLSGPRLLVPGCYDSEGAAAARREDDGLSLSLSLSPAARQLACRLAPRVGARTRGRKPGSRSQEPVAAAP